MFDIFENTNPTEYENNLEIFCRKLIGYIYI